MKIYNEEDCKHIIWQPLPLVLKPLNLTPLELNIEVQEMPADGSLCSECNKLIEGNMFQYFMFEGLEPTATKFKVCETCYEEKK